MFLFFFGVGFLFTTYGCNFLIDALTYNISSLGSAHWCVRSMQANFKGRNMQKQKQKKIYKKWRNKRHLITDNTPRARTMSASDAVEMVDASLFFLYMFYCSLICFYYMSSPIAFFFLCLLNKNQKQLRYAHRLQQHSSLLPFALHKESDKLIYNKTKTKNTNSYTRVGLLLHNHNPIYTTRGDSSNKKKLY